VDASGTFSVGDTELVPWVNGDGPIDLEVRVGTDDAWSRWFDLGHWRIGHATSRAGQSDAIARVETDTVIALVPVTRWQLRCSGQVRACGAVTSGVRPTPRPWGDRGAVELDVPAYAQNLHAGGEGWCSPTSVAMVVDFWRDPTERDGEEGVATIAIAVHDAAYGGAGNWTFNVAYAGALGFDARVDRFADLIDVEPLIRDGIPVVCGVSFTEAEMTGAGYSTAGHLLVLIGFTETGDVIVNDPAAHGTAQESQVRSVFGREEFERAWNGYAYVIA
jgi:hypothetical protein